MRPATPAAASRCPTLVLTEPTAQRRPASRPRPRTVPRAFSREKPMVIAGDRMRLTPPARARSDSPHRRLWQARWAAASEDEQAVSIERLGPRKSKRYEMRLAAMLSAPPVLA